jgi:Glycosyltransferase family 87
MRKWAFVALVAGFAVWGAALGLHPRRAVDLRIYVLAAERFAHGLPLYPLSDGMMPFKYAAAASWLFLPLMAIPPRFAAVLWNAGGILAFAAAARVWQTALREPGRSDPSDWLLVAATLALGQSFFLELFFGQVDLWMLVLLTVPLSVPGRRPGWTGLSVAIACLLKPTAVLVCVALVVARRFRALACAAGFVALLHVPLLVRYGASGAAAEISSWLATLDRTTAPWVLGHNPQGLPTLVLGLFFPADFAPSRAVLAAAEIGAAVAFTTASALLLRGASLWAALCFGAALVSPLAWRANFVLAWPFLVAVLAAQPRRAATVAVCAAVAAVEWLFNESLLGIPRAHAALATRAWGFAFVALAAAGFAVLSSFSAARLRGAGRPASPASSRGSP